MHKILKHYGNVFIKASAPQFLRLLPIVSHIPRRGQVSPCENLGKSRLAGAVLPHNHHMLSLLNPAGQAFQRIPVTAAVAEMHVLRRDGILKGPVLPAAVLFRGNSKIIIVILHHMVGGHGLEQHGGKDLKTAVIGCERRQTGRKSSRGNPPLHHQIKGHPDVKSIAAVAYDDSPHLLFADIPIDSAETLHLFRVRPLPLVRHMPLEPHDPHLLDYLPVGEQTPQIVAAPQDTALAPPESGHPFLVIDLCQHRGKQGDQSGQYQHRRISSHHGHHSDAGDSAFQGQIDLFEKIDLHILPRVRPLEFVQSLRILQFLQPDFLCKSNPFSAEITLAQHTGLFGRGTEDYIPYRRTGQAEAIQHDCPYKRLAAVTSIPSRQFQNPCQKHRRRHRGEHPQGIHHIIYHKKFRKRFIAVCENIF